MTKSLRDRIGLIAFFALLLTFLTLAAVLLAPFAGPIICALSAAIVLWPIHRWMSRKLPKVGKSLRALISTVAVLLLIVGPLVVIMFSIANEAVAIWPSVKDHLVSMHARFNEPGMALPAWTNRI